MISQFTLINLLVSAFFKLLNNSLTMHELLLLPQNLLSFIKLSFCSTRQHSPVCLMRCVAATVTTSQPRENNAVSITKSAIMPSFTVIADTWRGFASCRRSGKGKITLSREKKPTTYHHLYYTSRIKLAWMPLQIFAPFKNQKEATDFFLDVTCSILVFDKPK